MNNDAADRPRCLVAAAAQESFPLGGAIDLAGVDGSVSSQGKAVIGMKRGYRLCMASGPYRSVSRIVASKERNHLRT
jgi:hypothetical protein